MDFEPPMYADTGKKFVCWVVCKPILVFYFGPNQALKTSEYEDILLF